MPNISLNFKTDIWQKLPNTIQRLGEEGYIYRFYDQCFKTLMTDSALPKLNLLIMGIFLDTATGTFLDEKGKEYGVRRKVAESDEFYRERIRFIKVIRIYGLSRYAIKLYVLFRTDYETEILDEYEIGGRIENPSYNKFPENSAVIHSMTGTYSRAYIRFWNVPPLNTGILYQTLRDIVEPYNRVILIPYTNIEAVKKVLDYYCDSYTLTNTRREKIEHPTEKASGTIIQSTSYSRKAFPTLIENRPTWNTNPLGIKLHTNPSIPIEDLKKELENRVASFTYYIRFSNIDALLQNYISGTYTDITPSIFDANGSGYFILPSQEDWLVLDVEGNIRVDPVKLRWEIEWQFGKKVIIFDPIYKKLKELLSIPFKVYWGSDIGSWIYPRDRIGYLSSFQKDGYVISQDIIKKHVYIQVFGNVVPDEELIISELKLVKPDKDYYFI